MVASLSPGTLTVVISARFHLLYCARRKLVERAELGPLPSWRWVVECVFQAPGTLSPIHLSWVTCTSSPEHWWPTDSEVCPVHTPL